MIAFGYRGTANCIVDTSAIRADLGYEDVQSVDDGLRDVVDEMLASPEDFVDHPNNVDPFDYDTEDRVMAVWRESLARLQEAAAPIAAGLQGMPTPQTAKGSGADAGDGDGHAEQGD